MKTRLKLLMIALLLTTWSYSQTTFPKQIVLNNDTNILITPFQLRKANEIFVERDMFKNIDSINCEIQKKYSIIISNQKMVIENDNEKIENFKEIDINKDKQIDKLNKVSKIKNYIGAVLLIIALCL